MRFTGFSGPDKCGLYQPERVSIERPDGQVLRTWCSPQQSVRDPADAPWDDLYLVFFCGFSVWNYLTTPFLLANPDVKVEELPPLLECDQQWRRLRAAFPPTVLTHSSEQIFYFDAKGLQRRTDRDLLETKVADYSWAHQAFCGIVIPTLRRSLMLQPNGTVVKKPSLFDVEIFDASFE